MIHHNELQNQTGHKKRGKQLENAGVFASSMEGVLRRASGYGFYFIEPWFEGSETL